MLDALLGLMMLIGETIHFILHDSTVAWWFGVMLLASALVVSVVGIRHRWWWGS